MSEIAMAAGAVPAKPQARKRRLRLSIRFKFILSTVALIALVMSAVGYSLYVQQRKALTREVLGRGLTVAENLAAASRDALIVNDLLNLSVLANRAVEQGVESKSAEGHDLRSWADIKAGLGQAYRDLAYELPKAVEQGLSMILARPVDLGLAVGAAPKQAQRLENEGVFEAQVVASDGTVASDYRGTSIHNKETGRDDDLVGIKYQPPVPVQERSAGFPYAVYALKVHGQERRLFHLVQPIVENSTGKNLGWVHLGLDEDLVNRVIFKVTLKLIVIGLLAVLAGMIFTFFVATYLTAPIGLLGSGVSAIAGGNFDTRVKVSSRDELGELTHSFNTMADSLGQNERLKGAFTRYVSDAALQQILSDPSKTGLHSKRTLATIYTSDVRGFTSMSETLEPEQVVQIINTYLGLQTQVILDHGGVVDKFIGDATIGVWGKEAPGKDDAFNAVKAAWESQKAIAKLNAAREAKGEVAKLVGIGVNTGEIVSGNMGSSKKMEYTVTGEHVILADQICAECPGGLVWISASTYELVKDRVLVESAAMKAKGTKVYQMVGFK